MNERRRGLGRGLGALIPSGPERPVDVFFGEDRDAEHEAPATPQATDDQPSEPLRFGRQGLDPSLISAVTSSATGARPDGALRVVPGATYAEVPVGSIVPNAKQPRTVFDEDDMAELVASITQIGVLQPIVVRPIGRGADAESGAEFELIMGERRWRASQQASLATIPAIIRSTDDDEMLRHALLENLHRSQLNPLEEAAAYSQLLEDFGCTHDELATRLGRSRPQISNTIRLLKLPPLVARRVAAGVLSAGHARALLALDDAAAQERVAQRIVAEGLSVRSVEEIVAVGATGRDAKPASKRASRNAPELNDLAARLSDAFETRVAVTMGRSKGRMTVDFASIDDLHRILALMGAEGSASD